MAFPNFATRFLPANISMTWYPEDMPASAGKWVHDANRIIKIHTLMEGAHDVFEVGRGNFKDTRKKWSYNPPTLVKMPLVPPKLSADECKYQARKGSWQVFSRL